MNVRQKRCSRTFQQRKNTGGAANHIPMISSADCPTKITPPTRLRKNIHANKCSYFSRNVLYSSNGVPIEEDKESMAAMAIAETLPRWATATES